MFDSRLGWYRHTLKLEGEIRWGDDLNEEQVHLKEIIFAYKWDEENQAPTELKVGISSTLAQIDGLAHKLVPPPPPGPEWDELLESLDRSLHDVGYDASAALLLNATPEFLEELTRRLGEAGATDLDAALEDEQTWNLLFSFEHYEMEGFEVELPA